MRKITADYIFAEGKLLKNAVLVLAVEGTILELLKDPDSLEGVEKLQGILCPGFINTHCHLELSHLKGRIPEKLGLDGFIRQIEALRRISPEEVQDALVKADEEMLANGIVAVGDISNTSDSFARKKTSKLYYHTFLEIFAFHPSRAEKALAQGEALYKEYTGTIGNAVSITPHAPYSASERLLNEIGTLASHRNSILTIHNQESPDEDMLFKYKTGKILQRIEAFGFDLDFWQPTGKSSLQSTLLHLPPKVNLQLVHNTFTSAEDLSWAKTRSDKLWWCFCPAANLYIEDRLPSFSMFEGEKICIGTDSLASNSKLSILEEIRLIGAADPRIGLEKLLGWSTTNGAAYLGIEDRYGSFRKDTRPGVNLITSINLQELSLTDSSGVHVIA